VTPDAIARVRATALQVTADERFAPSFYRHLFEAAPSVRPMFAVPLEVQQRKFNDQLAVLMRALDDFSKLAEEARALGARHAGYGVVPAHYAIVRDALLAALADVLGPLDPDTEAAWRAAYDLVAEEMQAHADV
jgi:hemoglobin-like flavoprotein